MATQSRPADMAGLIFYGGIPGVYMEESMREDDFSMPFQHFHNSIELYFLLEGERLYIIDQTPYHVTSQSAVLIRQNQAHRTCTFHSSSSYHRVLFQLDPEILNGYLKPLGWQDPQTYSSRCEGTSRFNSSQWSFILELFRQLKLALNPSGPANPSAVMLHILELLNLIGENCCCENDPVGKNSGKGTKRRELVHQIARYVSTHCCEDLQLTGLAAEFYLSKSYLTRIFKAETGFTITEYQNLCRIKKAQLLLMETELSITEIAGQTGFGNITYFDKVFLDYTSISPLHYRKTAATLSQTAGSAQVPEQPTTP